MLFYNNNNKILIWIFLLIGLLSSNLMAQSRRQFSVVAHPDNNLVRVLKDDGYKVIQYPTVSAAIEATPRNEKLLLLAQHYPQKMGLLTTADLSKINRKKLKVYVEYANFGKPYFGKPDTVDLERVVVKDNQYFKDLPNMSLLTVNGSYILPAMAKNPFLVIAKVAGFDSAVYGLENTPYKPLLYAYNSNILVATTALSNFAQARFMPERSWQKVWEGILSQVTGEDFRFRTWLSFVSPTYGRNTPLTADARRQSVKQGITWFFNGHFLIDPSWEKDWVNRYIGDGSMPIGPELPADARDGDGTHGVLEGHCAFVYYDGRQKYRYWLRNDVQGESSMAFALAGKLLGNNAYRKISENLSDFSFERFRQGPRNNPDSASFGLLSWAVTNPGVYYGDDNARSVLGTIVAAATIGEKKWDKKVVEAILANFRTTGKFGFRGECLQEADLAKNGWKYYWNSDKVSLRPHFEAWPWACYLWLYNKTGYKPLLDRTKTAIRMTMEGYPKQWIWTNGIQQERARMLLPLAWLVRVEPTDEHKRWLDLMVSELLKNQVKSGGIREELGDPSAGTFGKTKSNADYGKHEAPLIFNNGDPIADMLYTTNFAFVGLNEAAKATGNPRYQEALFRMSDFLTRVQVKSEHFKNIDGAWFRAFNYENWDYWASNADAGWGAWSTLTGWIQSWILATQVMVETNSSLWDESIQTDLKQVWEPVKNQMLNEKE